MIPVARKVWQLVFSLSPATRARRLIIRNTVRDFEASDCPRGIAATANAPVGQAQIGMTADLRTARRLETERRYKLNEEKIQRLDKWLPSLKKQIRESFDTFSNVATVFLEIDDFYHLNRADQPLVMDYIHRLCGPQDLAGGFAVIFGEVT